MQISTSRFGDVDVQVDDIILFPNGIAGFEELRHWVILSDEDNEAVAWLQCVSQPETAVPVISPRRFVPEYRLRVSRNQLSPLQIDAVDQAYILGIVSRNDGKLTINLRAPLIINLDRRIGRQVVTIDEQPVQHELTGVASPLRKSA
jgi:flagellar assembly factor FliW